MAESLENPEEILNHGVSELSSTFTSLTLISTTTLKYGSEEKGS